MSDGARAREGSLAGYLDEGSIDTVTFTDEELVELKSAEGHAY